MIEESESQSEVIPSISIGDLVWTKVEGYRWWPSVILSITDKDKKHNPLKWKVVFLGEHESFQFLTRQKIKTWEELTTNRKDKHSKENNTFFAAIAFGEGILAKDFTLEDHKAYLSLLKEGGVSLGRKGVDEFKAILKGESAPLKSQNNDNGKGTSMRSGIEEEMKNVFEEMESIKRNMDKIMKIVPPDQLLKNFIETQGLKNCGKDGNDIGDIDMDSADDRMALLNYLEFLCKMYKIPYEVNESLTLLLNSFNNTNK